MPEDSHSLPYTTSDALWQAALAELRLKMLQTTYDAWLSGSYALTSISSLERLTVSVPSPYGPAWLTQRLTDVIKETLFELTGRPIAVSFVPGGCVEAGNPVIKKPLTLSSTPLPQQGASIMTNQIQPAINAAPLPSSTNESRVRIYSHLTQSRFLHIEDSLQIGKVRLFAGRYKRKEGMSSHAHFFLDIPDTRVIFRALAIGEVGFSHKEYKGTPPTNGRFAVSRVLSVTAKGENVYIELKTGPGKMTDTGAILPAGQGTTTVNVSFKRYEAQRMAASVLAYLRAWDVVRMLTHQKLVGQPPAYRLVPTVSEAAAAANSNGRNGQKPQPVAKKTAVSASAQPTANGNGRVNTQPVVDLMYGDGTVVDQSNWTEVETFQSYLVAKQAAPAAKAALLAYYREAAG